jgi:hypothetical protein
MPDTTLISSARRTRTPHPVVARIDDSAPAWLSFRDFAAIQIAAAMKGGGRDLSPRETAEVAFDIAAALEEERQRRLPRLDAPWEEPVPGA